MSRIPILAGVCALVVLSPSAARAQAYQIAPAIHAAPTLPARSMVGSDRLGVSQPQVAHAAATTDPLAAFRRVAVRHRGPGVALMIVGAAGVITGLLIDESIITVAGAGAGLIGLYLYLR